MFLNKLQSQTCRNMDSMEAETTAAEGSERHSPGYPRDLLRRFADSSSLTEKKLPELCSGGGGSDDSDEIELSLGLSLNGSFGIDPKLVRSSSVASAMAMMMPVIRELEEVPSAGAGKGGMGMGMGLARTCSLPAETEETRRKRKEIQSLKRLVAKRKRSEKRRERLRGSGGGADETSKEGEAAQGSIASQGSSSSASAVSEFEIRPVQGLEAKSPSSSTSSMMKPLTELVRHSSLVIDTGKAEQCPLRRRNTGGGGEMERNMMEEMPCVSTTGGGPNGRRVEGFLYKYRKGEEVRIVCVCHGSFLTPAEFVKHAGGGDVAHPLRHIVVNPSPSPLL